MMFEPGRVDQLRVIIEGIEYSFHEDADGSIIATVVKYPSCQAYGATLEEALDAAQETLIAILEEMEGMGGPLPEELQPFLAAHRARGC